MFFSYVIIPTFMMPLLELALGYDSKECVERSGLESLVHLFIYHLANFDILEGYF